MEGEEAMTSKEKILSKLKENSEALKKSVMIADEFEMPDFKKISPVCYEDSLEKFIENAKKISGARVEELKESQDINELIRQVYPAANIIASSLNNITSDINPDLIENAKELMKVGVGVVKGSFGVAENGCVWIPQTMKERAVCFASEYLVILLDKKEIVNNMHEAYDIIEKKPEYFEPYKFGTFISGPSKTADIESALVYGAQAARGVTLILL